MEQPKKEDTQFVPAKLVNEIDPNRACEKISEKQASFLKCTPKISFRPMSPQTRSSLIEYDEDYMCTDEEPIDPAIQVIEDYSDLIDELYDAKMPKWRLVYEMTGRLDVKFKGVKKMGCQIEDVRKSKLNFIDNEKTMLNLKEPANNQIFMDQNKKLASITSTSVPLKNKKDSISSSEELTSKRTLPNITLAVIKPPNKIIKTAPLKETWTNHEKEQHDTLQKIFRQYRAERDTIYF